MAERAFQLFEISWEVGNKVGGIHTVLSSKAKTAISIFGDDYVTIGPQLLGGASAQPFDDEPGFEAFIESCRGLGVPVRVGRWRVPGRPRCLLVGFSGLYEKKDGILAGLWERHKVDSLAGDWDYVEPVLFSIAAGMVIERWWEEFLAPFRKRAVVQAHEWMTGACLLHLKDRIPSIGTVFTTHATMLGRALASTGTLPEQGLGGKTPDQLSQQHGVRAKHSLEGTCARSADVFTTVSAITAAEAELLHGRKPEVLLPNGIDLDVVDELAAGNRDETREKLSHTARALLGDELGDAAWLCISGRYEFHNKGIELLLDALVKMKDQPGRPVLAFVMVPAGNSGVRGELRDRLKGTENGSGPLGLCTHNLFDEEHDPVHAHCKRIGLDNKKGARVKIVQVPIYLRPDDGFLNLEYEAVLAAMDLGVFPSFYEPWGYTPQEALALGLPTVTTDLAGFGRWAKHEGLGAEDGITVLAREKVPYPEVTAALVQALEGFLAARPDHAKLRLRCRAAAGRTAWKDLFVHYQTAYDRALDSVQQRSLKGVPQFRLPRRELPAPGASGITPRLSSFEAAATLPAPLRGLERLARNFWWSWNPGVRVLFRDLAPGWSQCHENPVLFLQQVGLEALEQRAKDRDYLKRVNELCRRFDGYLAEGQQELELRPGGPKLEANHPVAYFSAEFGVHSSLPIYSGGLGILAGDHLKSASDLGLPLVGVGLFYRMGYFRQQLSADGQQVSLDRENNPRQLAIEPVRGKEGAPLEIALPLPGRELKLRAWLCMVGRVRLYLLDTNVPSNRPEDRDITRNLYGGDPELRIQQEIVLGRGGVRLLRDLGMRPAVYHMNEGHAAFLALERISRLVRGAGLPFEAAREYVADTTMFTTHTPVPAGHDRFGEDLMRRYFGDAEEWVGLPWDRFFALGMDGSGRREFNMTYLAMNFAGFYNGVSKLHGVASQKLLHAFWPGLLQSEVPVQTITNGVHLATWTGTGIADLLRPDGEALRPQHFQRAAKLSRRDLWRVRTANKALMLEAVRGTLEKTFHARGDSPVMLSSMVGGLDEGALYIGFARRFAPYKRAELLFSDPARLLKILGCADRPVRVLVAGKAHPRDKMGQDLIKRIVNVTRQGDFVGKVLFVEDYDMAVAKALVQGVDVWLNTPTRMEEASGTSGMKAAANGVLNLSIADGWWPEAADGGNGWTIGAGQVYANTELQNQADVTALYRLLEEDVVPAFFTRNGEGLPEVWLDMVVHCLGTVPTQFNTDRMVGEYLERAYRPLATSYFSHQQENKARARERAKETQRVVKAFEQVKISSASTVELGEFKVGQHLDARLEVDLGSLQPEDVNAELVIGHSAGQADLKDMAVVRLEHKGAVKGSVHAFEGSYRVELAGQYSHGMRVRAALTGRAHDGRLRGLVLWA